MTPYPSWLPIIHEICERRRIGWKDVIGGCRRPGIVRCRHEIWWTLRQRTGVSYQNIGDRTGGFDHSSVRHGVCKWQAKVDEMQRRVAA